MNLPDISIDIETLGIGRTAVILEIGIVNFDSRTGVFGVRHQWYPDIEEQIAAGRGVDDETILWWLQTDITQMLKLLRKGPKLKAQQVEELLMACFADTHVRRIWTFHPLFDINILDTYCGVYKSVSTRHYRRKFLDVASVLDVCALPPEKKHVPAKAHDALEDAIAQARNVVACYAAKSLPQ